MIEPLKAAQSWNTREMVILKATQTGGSLVGQLILEWYIANRPFPTMHVSQTNKDSEVHMRDRILPNLKANAAIAPFMPSDPRQLRLDGIRFSHMSFLINGPSRDRIHGKTIGLMFLDELWRYGTDSFLEYARKRVAYYKKFGMSLIVIISQAGEEGDDLDTAWKESTMERWNVPCEKCGKLFYPDIEQFNASGKKWNDKNSKIKNADGSYNYGLLEQVLTLECPHCQHLHKDTAQLKQLWNEGGQYISNNPTPLSGHRGFQWNAFVTDPWIDIVKEFLEAVSMLDKGIVEPLLTFFQQRLARPINVWSFAVKGRSVQSNVDYSPIDPIPDEAARFMSVDVQDTNMFFLIRAYSKDGASRLIDFGEIFDVTDILAKQKEHNIPPQCVLVDTGFKTREVYGWILKYGFLGVKGVGGRRGFRHEQVDKRGRKTSYFRFWQRSDPDPSTGGSGEGKDKRIRAPFYLLAVDSIKDVLVRLRDGKGSEFLALPSEKYNLESYQVQMFSEYKARDRTKVGNNVFFWRKVKHDARNEYWDLEVYCLAAALMHPGIRIKESSALPTTEDLLKDGKTERPDSISEQVEGVKGTENYD